MASPELSHIYKVLEELNKHQSIPSVYWTTLEERLVIACKPLGRQPRRKVPRSKRDVRLHYKQKKAQRVYLEVLDGDPHIFLPFILAISPKACESFDVSSFHQHHDKNYKNYKTQLCNDAKSTLEEIAKSQGIGQSPHYNKLIKNLFPKVSFRVPKPVTSAEGNEHWRYHAADLKAIRIVFGDFICDAVERAPIRMREKARSQTIQTTECVRTNFPLQNFQDGIMWLDVGPASEFARILFPGANDALDGYGEVPARKMSGHQGIPTSDLEINDHAYFTLKGASISAISSIFNRRVCDAIEKSDLRAWEKEHLLLDTTDCVTMNMCRKEPQHGTIRLRIEFSIGIHLANTLYADTGIL